MNAQGTVRFIDEQKHEVYKMVFQLLDCYVDCDGETASKAAYAAQEAVEKVLRAEMGTEATEAIYAARNGN